jgi:hypothetical protein
MRLIDFCERFIFRAGEPISFADRGYLQAPYESSQRNLVLRCSRQVEKTTLLINRIIYHAVTNPGIQMILVCPRTEQAGVFSKARLLPTIENSPLIRRALLGSGKAAPQVMHYRFANQSQLFIRAAYHSADAVRGLSADILFIDEFQDIADGYLPVLQETLSHSQRAQIILTGTPKSIDNHLESVFQQSTACEWQVSCDECRRDLVLDERVLGALGLACPTCGHPFDPRNGRWVARNPDSRWGDGFWINHLMVPWLNVDDVLSRQATYDPAVFKNECLGLPTLLGDHVVTRAEVEACCLATPMANTLADVPREAQQSLFAGIDWGGGGKSKTVLVIGYTRGDLDFVVVRFDRFVSQEDPDRILNEVVNRCRDFNVRYIAADGGGNGHVLNRLLLDKLSGGPPLYAILYSASNHEPRQDGALWKWTVNRSASIGTVFSRIKKQLLRFPRVQDCGTFLEDFIGEMADYDDHMRTIRYFHIDTQPDDALHATNYAQMVALRYLHAQNRWAE